MDGNHLLSMRSSLEVSGKAHRSFLSGEQECTWVLTGAWRGAEARGGLHIVEQSLWAAVPTFLRRLSAALKKHTGRELPIGPAPLNFGSWMGGDRDGNPNVTASVRNPRNALVDLAHRSLCQSYAGIEVQKAITNALLACIRKDYVKRLMCALASAGDTQSGLPRALDGRGSLSAGGGRASL